MPQPSTIKQEIHISRSFCNPKDFLTYEKAKKNKKKKIETINNNNRSQQPTLLLTTECFVTLFFITLHLFL